MNHFHWEKHVRALSETLTPMSQYTQTRMLHANFPRKHLKCYHKYFFLHVYPGRGPNQSYSSCKQTGNTSSLLTLYLNISTTQLTLHWWHRKSTGLASMGINLVIHRGLKSLQEVAVSSLWMITTRWCRLILFFLCSCILIQHWDTRWDEDLSDC